MLERFTLRALCLPNNHFIDWIIFPALLIYALEKEHHYMIEASLECMVSVPHLFERWN